MNISRSCVYFRRGFTLTELAITLGVIGAVFGGIWMAASMVYENNRTKRAYEQALLIVTGFKNMYDGKRFDLGDWQDVTQVAISNQIIPTDMISPNSWTGVTTPWGGPTMFGVRAVSSRGSIIELNWGHLPNQACVKLASNLVNNGQQLGLILIGFNWRTPYGNWTPNSVSLGLDQIVQQCNNPSTEWSAGDSNITADFVL
jgi:prepilin-type N-terminal cleavage/methylation domain-containing protein